MRRHLAVAAGVSVSGLFLWLAFRNADLNLIRDSLGSANLSFAAPFLLCLFIFYWLKSSRWRQLLSPAGDVRSGALFPIIMIGYAGTAVLPMQMGEFVRAYIASRRYSLPYSLVLSSIVMERLFDLLTILAMLGIVLTVGQSTPQILIDAGYVIGFVTLIGLMVSFALVVRTEQALAAFRRILTPLPEQLTAIVMHQIEAAVRGLESIRQPRLSLRIAANSIVQWGLMGLCIFSSLAALGLQVPTSGVMLVLVATIIGISLPSSPGHIGNVQIAYVVALQPFGVSAEQAIAASIFYHLLAYVTVVVVGFWYVHRMGFGMLELQAKARGTDSVQ